jgi:hypothetical protein
MTVILFSYTIRFHYKPSVIQILYVTIGLLVVLVLVAMLVCGGGGGGGGGGQV